MDFFEGIQVLLIFLLFLWLIIRLTYPIKRLEQYKVNELYDALSCVDLLLTQHDVPYFMTCGTLLGAVRDQGLIPHDNDVDLALLESELPKLLALKPDFQALGIELSHEDDIWRLGRANSKVWIDVFPYVLSGDTYVHAHERNRDRFPKETFSYEEIFPLIRLSFGPLQLPAPAQAEIILRRIYGSNWGRPIATQGHNEFLSTIANFSGRDVSGLYSRALPSIVLSCGETS